MSDEARFALIFVGILFGLWACGSQPGDVDDYPPEDCVVTYYQSGPICE